MVSPCKKEDTRNHHVNYSFPSKQNYKTASVKGATSKTQVENNRIKPYANKVIYLDLKSRKESASLEASLKALGAVVAVFLDRSVTHVVSDRLLGPGGSSALASPAASVSPRPSNSPCTSDRYTLPRTRGAAMLERVSGIASAAYADPVSLAQQWHVPVLTVARLWADIARHAKAPQARSKSDFIKVESLVGSWKPDLLKLDHWPTLDLDSPTGLSPFQWDVSHGVTPTNRKGNTEEESTGATIGNKASALCNGTGSRHSSHDDLKVQCNGLSAGIRTSKLLSPSGSDVLPLPTQRRSTRRASASWCGSTRELSQLSPALSPPPASPPLSPSDSELGVTLRPKGTLWLPVALIGTTAEEHGNSIRRRGGSDASLSSLDASKPRRKKLSPEEKLLQDNKDYFKMEVLHTKLRSSGPKHMHAHHNNHIALSKVVGKRRGRWASKHSSAHVDSVDYEALITENKIMKLNGLKKPKRPRRSELMKLCDEAESFMFGESSRQSAASAASVSGAESEEDRPEDVEDVRPRRKRRSHAEALIHDNQDYYKFETPGSRLRSHGSFSEQDGAASTASASDDGHETFFSFQTAPCTEPWFDVFRRQDEGREQHFPVISDPANQLFLLPYERPRLPAPKPEPAEYYVKRRLRLAQILAQNHPRKSPRCHASTLAILSSLKRRKRRSSASAGADSSPHKDDLLGLTDESVEELTLLDPDVVELPATAATPTRRKKTEERASFRTTLRVAPAVPIDSRPADVLELIASFRSAQWPSTPPLPEAAPAPPHPRRRRRKARFNKTGWDKVKTRVRRASMGKGAPANTGIAPENIVLAPRRSVNGSPPAVPPCVVRVRKLNHAFCRKLVVTRRRKAKDYSWTSGKR